MPKLGKEMSKNMFCSVFSCIYVIRRDEKGSISNSFMNHDASFVQPGHKNRLLSKAQLRHK